MSSGAVRRRTIDIGCGPTRDPRADFGMDFYAYPGATLVHDATVFPWPIPGESFDGAVSHQMIEHIPQGDSVAGQDVIFRFFDEVWRVLRPGATFAFDVPHVRSRAANCDLTHRRFLNEQAFTILWTPGRDPLCPRRTWELVECRVDRWYGWGWVNTWHFQKYLPRVDRILCWWRIGAIHDIRVTIRKPRRT